MSWPPPGRQQRSSNRMLRRPNCSNRTSTDCARNSRAVDISRPTRNRSEENMKTDEIRATLARQHIETPSWAYGNSGTRFKVFSQTGIPRDAFEKITDAAVVHKHTGVAPSVAVHIPWDKVDDYAELAKHAGNERVKIGAVNPNTFQDDDYRLGSVCNT